MINWLVFYIINIHCAGALIRSLLGSLGDHRETELVKISK